MAKRKNIPENISGDDAPEQRRHELAFTLVTGSWRKLFNIYESRLLIAEALNYCVYSQELVIRGYQITPEKVYLVLQANHDRINRILLIFFEKVRRELLKHIAKLKSEGVHLAMQEEIWEGDNAYTALFEKHTGMNRYLRQMLTGKKATPPYYDPEWQYVQQSVHHCDFCSLVDYSGAKGPVEINYKWTA